MVFFGEQLLGAVHTCVGDEFPEHTCEHGLRFGVWAFVLVGCLCSARDLELSHKS